VGYALVIDALTHDGLASAHRINRGVCAQPAMPGVDPVAVAVAVVVVAAVVAAGRQPASGAHTALG